MRGGVMEIIDLSLQHSDRSLPNTEESLDYSRRDSMNEENEFSDGCDANGVIMCTDTSGKQKLHIHLEIEARAGPILTISRLWIELEGWRDGERQNSPTTEEEGLGRAGWIVFNLMRQGPFEQKISVILGVTEWVKNGRGNYRGPQWPRMQSSSASRSRTENSRPAEGSSVKISLPALERIVPIPQTALAVTQSGKEKHWQPVPREQRVTKQPDRCVSGKNVDESRIGRRTRAQNVQANGMQMK
ncbi:hypothetical protein B0H14DRAFT_2648187 [Mycena olivaceomarginata]|nr:hypothetical protein B0H14DRAFT_2648187 [Mycena olivaceomarginata]